MQVCEFPFLTAPNTRSTSTRSSCSTPPSVSASRSTSSTDPYAVRCYRPDKLSSVQARFAGQSLSISSPKNNCQTKCAASSRFNVSAAQLTTKSTPSNSSTSDVWELDFCSRPILDERKKKVWELLICDPDRNFEYQEYFPNNKINSAQLRMALERIMDQEGVARPNSIRFFRAQMQTIISKACTDLDIKAVPTRRCRSLIDWLVERHETVYPAEPGYDPNAPALMSFQAGAPQELSEALRGEQWAFVILPLAAVQEEAQLKIGSGFGEYLNVDRLDLPPDTLIPGVAVFSQRALPLAAWTNGLELMALKVDDLMGSLILETGINSEWRYASYRRSKAACQEALDWEEAKKAVGGVHFLAIQKDPEAEGCEGFWMLQQNEISSTI